MTYFPQPDPDRLRQAMNRQSHFVQTPPSSAIPQRPDGEWTVGTSSEELLPVSAAYDWRAGGHHGLGLLSAPSTTTPNRTTTTMAEHYYQDAIIAAQSMNMPFAWPSELARAQQPPVHRPQQPRADFWDGSCNPSSTLLPAEAMWNPLQATASSSAPRYDASPSMSTYSTSSLASVVSSPYAHSEAYTRTLGSPAIKLEESLDRPTPLIHVLPETEPFEQSLLIDPSDLVTRPPVSVDERVATSSLPSFGTSPILKQEGAALSPHQKQMEHRRAFSSESMRAVYQDDQRKRSYTKPENASCSCDVCGKLFQRSYNLKAHMETHDPDRNQPHICPYEACDKRFVRKTDLLRHEQSVHLKSRNYPCPLCGSCFARKDSLRRHVDDGCPKRPEVKRRVAKARRPSIASSSRRVSSQDREAKATTTSPLRVPARVNW